MYADIDRKEMKREVREEKTRQRKRREERKNIILPVFYTPITCLVLQAFLHIYCYFPKLKIPLILNLSIIHASVSHSIQLSA